MTITARTGAWAVMVTSVAWLQDNGWKADTEVNFVDVYARRGDECLYAEAKGRTAAIGLDE